MTLTHVQLAPSPNCHTGAGESDLPAGVTVTVAVLTYLRPDDLRRCLAGVNSEVRGVTRRFGIDADVLVVDNDPLGSARSTVAESRSELVRYALEPSPGISAGRNRALAECSKSRLLVFIDDDEVPRPGWLGNLLHTWASTAPAAVVGRVVSEFDGELDSWIVSSRIFERPNQSTGAQVGVAATNNLLLDLAFIRAKGLHFDERFGLSGGGDSLFTRSLVAAGGTIVWCDEAVVTDHVPISRMSRDWVVARSRRMANTEIRVQLELAGGGISRLRHRVIGGLRGAARGVFGGVRHLWGRVTRSESHQAQGLRTGARGIGMLAGSAGIVLHEYRRSVPGKWVGPFRRGRRIDGPGSIRTSSGTVGISDISGGAGLTVLASFPPPRPTTNPYIVMLARSLARTAGVRLDFFSWRRAITGHYRVFHVHWPETLIGGPAGPKKAVRQALFAMMLIRLRLTNTPIVRTVHNRRPHEARSRIERALLTAVDRRTVLRIGLNDQTEKRPGVLTETILLGHYCDWFAGEPRTETVPGTILMPGLVRAYKNVPALIKAFRSVSDDDMDLTLRIVGQSSDHQLSRVLTDLAAGDDRITLRLRHVPDEEFAREVGRSELVVLPYTDMFNSASALMALSFGRPILVPDNEINRRLGAEVGIGWVHRYSGTLGPEQLIAALDQVRRELPIDGPDLSSRNWDNVGDDHVTAYQKAMAQVDRSQR